MKTFEETVHSVLQTIEKNALMTEGDVKLILAAHQAEMDRVVEELVSVRTINHAGCSFNGKNHSRECDRETKHQERQRARYKAIKEGK